MKLALFILLSLTSLTNCVGQNTIIQKTPCEELPKSIWCGSPLKSPEDSVKKEISKIIVKNKIAENYRFHFSYAIVLDSANNIISIEGDTSSNYWPQIDKINNDEIISLLKKLSYADIPDCKRKYLNKNEKIYKYLIDIYINDGKVILQWMN